MIEYADFTAETGATLGSSGSVITLASSADTNRRTFAQAVTDGDLSASCEVIVGLVQSGGFATWLAAFANSGGTLTKIAELEASGTIADGAVSSVAIVLDAKSFAIIGRSFSSFFELPQDQEPLQWNGATTGVTLAGPGKAVIGGRILEWASGISVSYAPSTTGVKHVYLYDNAGTPALEINDTNVVADYSDELGYWHKSGDTSRRRVGFVYVWDDAGTKKIAAFKSKLLGRTIEWLVDMDVASQVTAFNYVIGGASATLAGGGFSLLSPSDVSHWLLDARIAFTSDGSDCILAVHPTNGANLLSDFQTLYHVRASSGKSSTKTFFGRFWLPRVSSTAYYRVNQLAGSPTGEIFDHGWRYAI